MALVSAMNAWAANNSPQFILTTGDNFYPDGVRVGELYFILAVVAHYENESKRRVHMSMTSRVALRCVQSANDAWFEQKWRRVYSGEHIRELQWRISLGNHDYNPTRDRPGPNDGGNEMFQVCPLHVAAF